MKRLIILIMLLCFLCGCASVEDDYLLSDDEHEVEADDFSLEGPDETVAMDSIFVYVCGQVLKPGVYELPPKSRAVEAVNAAGGMSDLADETAINLADILSDGQQIYIPQKAAAGDSDTVSGTITSSDGRVDINSGSIEELQKIPGIGATKAQSIVEYRESNGRFSSPKDITKVSGIGDGTYEKIKDHIKV